MTHFNNQYLRFFEQLENNNSSAWFNENRKTYEAQVKKPFQQFTEEMISEIQKHDPSVNVKASDCIFRINKDVRFAKEKIPYNIHMSANISPAGRKSHEYPGFYYQISSDQIMIAGGVYMVEKDSLQAIRSYILKHNDEFERIINSPDFKEKFREVKGEKNKIIPAEFKSSIAKQPLLANKSFYYDAILDPGYIISPNLTNILMEYYQAGKPFNDFMLKALQSK